MMLDLPFYRLSAVASLFALAHTLTGCICTSAGCDDSLTGEGTIAVQVGARAHLEVEACRNDVCSQGVLDSDTFDSKSMDGGILPRSGSMQLSGPAAVGCFLDGRVGAEFWEMRIIFRADDGAGDFDDGDVITLRVLDLQSGETIVHLQQTINYDSLSPNGLSCGPTCQSQTFAIPNAATSG